LLSDVVTYLAHIAARNDQTTTKQKASVSSAAVLHTKLTNSFLQCFDALVQLLTPYREVAHPGAASLLSLDLASMASAACLRCGNEALVRELQSITLAKWMDGELESEKPAVSWVL
jgi:hypothetical protein